jgi:nucleotide-binding universal stress UspA family protein
MAYRIRRKRLSLSVETAVLSGRTAREIVRYARDKGASVIVLGTHGRTGISRVLLGSVAEAVLRLAGRPVLIVPAEPEDAISPSPSRRHRHPRPRAFSRSRTTAWSA